MVKKSRVKVLVVFTNDALVGVFTGRKGHDRFNSAGLIESTKWATAGTLMIWIENGRRYSCQVVELDVDREINKMEKRLLK